MECDDSAKLDIDFPSSVRLGAPMEDDVRDLIAQLCTRAAMIMEDMAPAALAIKAEAEADQRETLETLDRELVRASSLIKAATALMF